MQTRLNIQLIRLQARLSFRALGHQILEVLHRRMIAIAVVALLLISPTALADYYQCWARSGWRSRGIALGVPLALGAGLLLFSYFEKGRRQTEALLLSLPISCVSRSAFLLVDAWVIQLPILLLPFLAGLNESWFHRELPSPTTWLWMLMQMATLIFFNGLLFLVVRKFSMPSVLRGSRIIERGMEPPRSTFCLERFPGLAVGILRLKLQGRVHYRRTFLSLFAVLVCSAVGWAIARVPNPEQPKAQLYLLLTGLSVLSCTWILQAGRKQDREMTFLLKSLPRSELWHERSSQLALGFALVPVVLQNLFWNAESASSSEGWMGFVLTSGMTVFMLTSQKFFASWHTVVSLFAVGILMWIQGIFSGALP